MGGARLFARKYNFSLLYIKDDLLAQVQNTAILLHHNAKWIFKIDEDIILSDNYFSKMKRAYAQAEKNQLCKIGYVSPVLNINDYGSMVFINTIGAMKEYESKFGIYSITAGSGKVFRDKDVATWIWEKSIPFDDVATNIESINKGKISESNFRVRIGAILLSREFVEEMGMFKVAGLEMLGVEELELCAYCMNLMYRIVIAEDVLCGHLGFSHQKEACKKFFEEHLQDFKHK